MKSSRGLVFLALVGCGPKQAPETPEPLPTVEAVLAKLVESTGGEAVIAETQRVRVEGTLDMPAQGMKGTIKTWTTPAGSRSEVALPGLGMMQQGYVREGDFGWAQDAMLGARLLEGGELEMLRKAADLQLALHLDDYYTSIQLVGRDVFGEAESLVVAMTNKSGVVEKTWYSVETGLPLAFASEVTTPMGSVPMQTTFEDYREVDGMMYAFRTINEVGPVKQVITLESVERNYEETEVFELPDAIRELVGEPEPEPEPESPTPEAPAE